MCLILFAWDAHPDYKLVVAANRDEFFERASLPMHWWQDRPVLGGRDLTAGGSWMTLSASGRFGAVTNVRDVTRDETAPRSRGEIPVAFSAGSSAPDAFVKGLPADEYAGYNVVVTDIDAMWWGNNHAAETAPVEPGVHAVSNAALDTPWPKVVEGKRRFSGVLASGAETEGFFAVLADTDVAQDDLLPDTGAGLELERLLSSAFISSPDYGTNAATVLRVGRDGSYDVEERRFLRGEETGRVAFAGRFDLST
ncbi:MAG: NRDE family protein [Aeromicrobium sp.]